MQRAKQKPIEVVLVDDHLIMCAGLRLLVETQCNAVVVGEAHNRKDALAITAGKQPDIVLLNLDLEIENSLELIPELLAIMKRGQVIVLAGLSHSGEQARAIQLGARGLVLKEDEVKNLVTAIERVHQGEYWFKPSISSRLIGRIASIAENVGKTTIERGRGSALTKRELDIITLVCNGLKNQSIADSLHLSEGTVRNHLTVIYEKLGVMDRFELIVSAYRHGLMKSALTHTAENG
jgi:DNA-binding NarL/FixJ family response regulator